MMKYFKKMENGYIVSIMTGKSGDVEITQEEYNDILNAIRNRPIPEAGYDYNLREDLTWELVKRPIYEDPELSAEEAMTIILGVSE